jgi:hypothetical protein
MAVDAVVVPNSPRAAIQARTLTQESNMQTVRLTDFSGNAYLDRQPEYYLSVFNIAPKQFVVNRPPQFSTIVFARCPEGQPWAKVATIPDIVGEKWVNADSGKIDTNGIPGEKFATDLVNPSNLGINVWQEVTDEQMTWIDGGTNDLTRRGVFWSRNEVPGRTCLMHGGCGELMECPVCKRGTLDELHLAKSRMEKHYKQLLLQADQYQREGHMREIGPEHHMAGDYFHVRSPWHVVAELPSSCPNCGDAIKEGVAFHVNAVGAICVLPTQDAWKRTVTAGVKKKSEVPEELRWWEPPQRGRPKKEAEVEA